MLPAAATVVTRTGSKARIQDPNAGAGGQDDLQPIPQCDPRFIDGLYGTNCAQAYPSFAITVVEINLDIRHALPSPHHKCKDDFSLYDEDRRLDALADLLGENPRFLLLLSNRLDSNITSDAKNRFQNRCDGRQTRSVSGHCRNSHPS